MYLLSVLNSDILNWGEKKRKKNKKPRKEEIKFLLHFGYY